MKFVANFAFAFFAVAGALIVAAGTAMGVSLVSLHFFGPVGGAVAMLALFSAVFALIYAYTESR